MGFEGVVIEDLLTPEASALEPAVARHSSLIETMMRFYRDA
jgi:hypothetical protein